nr:PepSY domain-containing protein [Cytophagales bacterium]
MKEKQESAWAFTRRWVNEIHLWMGIASGIIIFFVCLSGTIYTFKEEIQEWLEPERYTIAEIPTNQKRLPLAELISIIGEGTGKEVGSITIPRDLQRTYLVNVRGKEETGRGSNVPVNPYTGEITVSGDPVGSAFFMTMFRLHRWLLLDTEIGRPIVGWATIIFTLIIISGMVIWIPKKVKYWKQGLRIKWSGNWKRINHDLHNTLGFYSAFLLLVMSLTGLYWSFPWYKEGLFKVLGVELNGGGGGR